MTYTTLLFDIDNTLLNFKESETIALKQLFETLKVPYTKEVLDYYYDVNHKLWEAHERGEINQQTILDERFGVSLSSFNLPYTGREMDQMFRTLIEENNIFMPGAMELLEAVKDDYRLGIVTNGITDTQYKRLDHANIRDWFGHIFISQELGYAKPMIEFFEIVAKEMQPFNPAETIVLGDNIKADVYGAMNAGLTGCWYNPEGKANSTDIKPDFEINNLLDFLDIIK